jgi:transcriptional regulator with XRE-family HTH domain
MKAQNDQQESVSPLKGLRERLGNISQQELAARLGTSVTSISRWERGVKTVSLTIPQIEALLKQLRSVDWDVEQFLKDTRQFGESESAQDAYDIPGASTPQGGDLT